MLLSWANLAKTYCAPAPPPSSYHKVGDSVGIGRGRLAHPMVGHRPHTEDTLLLEHPAGEGQS